MNKQEFDMHDDANHDLTEFEKQLFALRLVEPSSDQLRLFYECGFAAARGSVTTPLANAPTLPAKRDTAATRFSCPFSWRSFCGGAITATILATIGFATWYHSAALSHVVRNDVRPAAPARVQSESTNASESATDVQGAASTDQGSVTLGAEMSEIRPLELDIDVNWPWPFVDTAADDVPEAAEGPLSLAANQQWLPLIDVAPPPPVPSIAEQDATTDSIEVESEPLSVKSIFDLL